MSGWYDNGRVYHIELSLQAVSPPAGDEIVVDTKKREGRFQGTLGPTALARLLREEKGNYLCAPLLSRSLQMVEAVVQGATLP